MLAIRGAILGPERRGYNSPDFLTRDLDPDESVLWNEVLGAALLLRDYLAERRLQAVVKNSGGKGLLIVLDIEQKYDWVVMKPFTKAVGYAVAAYKWEQLPDRAKADYTIHEKYAKLGKAGVATSGRLVIGIRGGRELRLRKEFCNPLDLFATKHHGNRYGGYLESEITPNQWLPCPLEFEK